MTDSVRSIGDRPMVLSIVGFQNAGKSTLVERLIGMLRAQGLRVAMIKHDGHADTTHQMNTPSWEKNKSDTDRAASAGADWTMVASTHGWLVHAWHDQTADVETWVEILLSAMEQRGQHVDIVLVEGAKHSHLPKLVIVRNQDDWDALAAADIQDVLAVCIGSDADEPINAELNLSRLAVGGLPCISSQQVTDIWQIVQNFFGDRDLHKNFLS